LVGADVLIKQKENALAVAGQKAAGNIGLIFVTVAACFSAASAVNATLFSVSRLARSSAERRLMPGIFARCNRKRCPYYSIIFLAIVSAPLAAMGSLDLLVETASLAFLLLFSFVNALTYTGTKSHDVLSLTGAIAAAAAAVMVGGRLFSTYPLVLCGFVGICIIVAIAFYATRALGRRRRGFISVRTEPAREGRGL